MDVFKQSEVWFVIGSQNLYGPKTLQQVMDNAHQVVNSLNNEAGLPVKLVLNRWLQHRMKSPHYVVKLTTTRPVSVS